MTLIVTAVQRDALYEQIAIRLTGIDAVFKTFNENDFEAFERLGREFSDNLRLMLDDLGIGAGTGEAVELTSPPDVLRRIMERLRDAAESRRVGEEKEQFEAEKNRAQNILILETCQSVLSALDAA
jgi:hypothetical protein